MKVDVRRGPFLWAPFLKMRLSTGINGKIDRMIRRDLQTVLSKYKGTDYKEIIRKYRDKNFLNGTFDYIFEEFIKNYDNAKYSNNSNTRTYGRS